MPRRSSAGTMWFPPFVIFSLSLLPFLVRSAPTSLSHLGPSHSARGLEGGQALLVATPPFTTGQEVAIGQPNATLSASSGSILIFPAAAPQGPSTVDPTQPLVMGYYPDWTGSSLIPENINFPLMNWIDFAFGIPDASFGITWDSQESPQLLRRLVDTAHKNSVKVKLSIGGWTGSRYFSSAVASSKSRDIFVQNIVNIYHNYSLDGIDIDWEYPGLEGAQGNRVNPSDSTNFLTFLQHLRINLPSNARITAAAQTVPFADGAGLPMEDVSSFAEVLDWVLIMNYDVWPASPTPGPNAPLNNGCKNSSQPGANAAAAYDAWTEGGFPASKLVLGLPSYGYVSDSEASGLRSRSPKISNFRRLRSLDDGSEEPGTTVKITGEDGSSTVQFRDLVRQGALVRSSPTMANSPAVYDAAGGFTRYWDTCSSTPWLRSTSVKQIIPFDDPESLYLKAEFAKRVGMLGVNVFDLHGDTDDWDLFQAVRQGLGIVK